MPVFDRVGRTTTEPQPNEDWSEQSRVWVANPRNHPEHTEFPRYAEGAEALEAVRKNPDVAFRVESLDRHMEGQEIIIEPFVAADFVPVVFVRKHGAIFK